MANEFRTTPQLGPQLDAVGPFYWDLRGRSFQTPSGVSPTTTDDIDPSYRLGNKEVGSDGHDYVLVRAHATITTGAFTVTEGTWATASGAGWELPPDVETAGGVKEGDIFHARKATL